MSPTYTMSAHLCKQIQKSFQTRQTSPELLSPTATYLPTYLRRSPSPQPEKRTSVDSDRSDASTHSVSSSSSSSSSSTYDYQRETSGGRCGDISDDVPATGELIPLSYTEN
ncbi:hypothetical protein F4813DRAFT_388920 [Daldinia decipiens]|uniref:uncharacterized protein n=1 Tax=Daldinia decipiens TaxID=326647 RepID=UPI0020C3542A|nr:uncharacterized protein F4813DRAFT_388920 [Daldinia decipiens]KAI1658140.1 hypothetical protein F4813DRAFT_388920 [Daldinia decipiens]